MSNIGTLVDALGSAGYGERLIVDEPLARYTSFHVGGPADILVDARSSEELVQLWGLAHKLDVPARFIGGGTNILVSDMGMRGLVVLNRARDYRLEDGTLWAESGVALSHLARLSAGLGWRGIEWACGIPGTLGGAVVGNAGAFGGEIADVLLSVRWLLKDGRIEKASADQLEYEYRNSALKKSPLCGSDWIILDVELGLKPDSADALIESMAGISRQRKERQPAGWSAGSIFKRTVQYPAGFLIDQTGLKGVRVGQAVISPQHANYIVNEGGATASDVMALIRLAQDRVGEQFSERLEPEIQLVGDWTDGNGEGRDV